MHCRHNYFYQNAKCRTSSEAAQRLPVLLESNVFPRCFHCSAVLKSTRGIRQHLNLILSSESVQGRAQYVGLHYLAGSQPRTFHQLPAPMEQCLLYLCRGYRGYRGNRGHLDGHFLSICLTRLDLLASLLNRAEDSVVVKHIVDSDHLGRLLFEADLIRLHSWYRSAAWVPPTTGGANGYYHQAS